MLAVDVEWPQDWCRTCGAKPGLACVTGSGRIAHKPHGQRTKQPIRALDGFGKGAPKRPSIPVSVRAQVRHRSQGRCEFVDGGGRRCSKAGVHLHHVKRRSQGGADTPENLKDFCSADHRWVHDNPEAARALGFLAQKGTA